MSIRYYGKPDNFSADPVSGVTEALASVTNSLPAGKLKDALTNFLKNPLALVTGIIQKIAGRTYQTGQYRLGERLMRHIMQQDPGSNANVPDEMVTAAQLFFTMALGVDINNDEDLQALDSGVDAYFARPDKTGIPKPAVERAVAIKKYWPMVKNGAWYIPWPVDVIYQIKSDPATMSYHSSLIDKDMPVPMEDKSTGATNVTGSTITESLKKPKTWIFILIGIVVLIGAIYLIRHKK